MWLANVGTGHWARKACAPVLLDSSYSMFVSMFLTEKFWQVSFRKLAYLDRLLASKCIYFKRHLDFLMYSEWHCLPRTNKWKSSFGVQRHFFKKRIWTISKKRLSKLLLAKILLLRPGCRTVAIHVFPPPPLAECPSCNRSCNWPGCWFCSQCNTKRATDWPQRRETTCTVTMLQRAGARTGQLEICPRATTFGACQNVEVTVPVSIGEINTNTLLCYTLFSFHKRKSKLSLSFKGTPPPSTSSLVESLCHRVEWMGNGPSHSGCQDF